MLKYYTNKTLSSSLGTNLAKWKRWSREFLPPDPLGGMQSGYARQYTPDEAFTVYLGGHLVADLHFTIPAARQILGDLAEWLTTELRNYPGTTYSFEGEARDERENSYGMYIGAGLIIFGIYAMLAIPFRSYLQPLVVMSVIPFGLIGAVLGHLLEDYLKQRTGGMPLSFLSYFGMLALSGVVVNDSLVLVDYINRRRKAGDTLIEAVSGARAARFRAIVLTSATTFAGLFPLIRMQATQAQFLIPMAVSLGYGIIFATLITLFFVPINYLIMEDILGGLRSMIAGDKKAKT